MINSITLKNYKGFKDFKASLSPITLIGGKNNTGKSSILEAIMFLFSHSDPNCFFKMNFYRQMNDQPLFVPERIWEPLFYNFNANNELEITLGDELDGDRCLKMIKNSQVSATSVNTVESMQNAYAQAGKLPSNYNLKFSYSMPGFEEVGNYVIANNGVNVNIESQKKEIDAQVKVVQLFKTETPFNGQLTTQWFGQLVLHDKKGAVIEALKLFDKNIIDIQTIVQGSFAYLYVIFANGTKIPLAYMGDGIGRLLAILMGVIANPHSIVLIDEVENGFHYSIYEKFWSMIGNAANVNGCQVIANTHSNGMIASAVAGLEEAGLKDKFTYIRLDKQGDVAKANMFDADLLDYALASEMEVR